MGGYQKRTAHIATDPKVVLFSTFDGRGYSDSPKAIYEYMCSDPRFADYTFVWAFREPKKFTYVLDHPNTYMVTVNTPAYEEACARAKYWFFNYRIADHIYPKDDQVYVQLWHGTPLKRLGYDISISDNAMNSKEEIRQKYKVDAEKFKYILAPSAFAAEKFISAWNLQAVGKADTVLEAGYPRNDFLINHTPEDEAQIKAKSEAAEKETDDETENELLPDIGDIPDIETPDFSGFDDLGFSDDDLMMDEGMEGDEYY